MGCVPLSLHPLYTEDKLVFEPSISGAWVGEDGEERWVFGKSGDKSYQMIIYPVTYISGKGTLGEPAEFKAHLVKLGDFLFLDICPEDYEIKNDMFELHLIPGHTFWEPGQAGFSSNAPGSDATGSPGNSGYCFYQAFVIV